MAIIMPTTLIIKDIKQEHTADENYSIKDGVYYFSKNNFVPKNPHLLLKEFHYTPEGVPLFIGKI